MFNSYTYRSAKKEESGAKCERCIENTLISTVGSTYSRSSIWLYFIRKI
jgi:hypothetical protein